MAQAEQLRAGGTTQAAAERQYAGRDTRRDGDQPVHSGLFGDRNIGRAEQWVSLASGAILAGLGIGRRDTVGLVIASVGGAMVYRGATGHCHMYQALGVNTADESAAHPAAKGATHVVHTFLVDKSPEELYQFWRQFENLPRIMSHLKSVRRIDDRRSHWVAKAPTLVGGEVEWEAEITADEPNSRIAWQSLPDSDIDHRGSVEFKRALGDRGTAVRVELEYQPPAGQLGRLVAKMFGEAPEQEIREDLRRFKREMEIGDAPTTEGQPRGTCSGIAMRAGRLLPW